MEYLFLGIQPFCRKRNINIGYFNGKGVWPRTITEKYIASKIRKNLFCLIWKPNYISSKKAKEDELKPNSKVVDCVISGKHVKKNFKNEYKPKKVQSPLTKIVVYGLVTFNKIPVVPYCSYIYKLRKVSGKYHRGISEQDYQKCLNVCVVFKGADCINEKLDHVLSFKIEPKRIKSLIVDNILFLIAHNESGFVSFLSLNILPQWRSDVNLIKNGAGVASLKKFNGYVVEKKRIPQYVHFRCGRVLINSSSKNWVLLTNYNLCY